jgi:hypothetical protein
VKLIFSRNPFGIVRIELFCIITFAGAVALLERVQLDVIDQFPAPGGEQPTIFNICGEPGINLDPVKVTSGIVFVMDVDLSMIERLE